MAIRVSFGVNQLQISEETLEFGSFFSSSWISAAILYMIYDQIGHILFVPMNQKIWNQL